MDIRTMRYYLAVVQEGTISKAAAALHVSQPSLSRQIKELEAELGVTLFTRGNRQIRLTEEGLVLKKRAEELVRLMELTEEELAQVKKQISGAIRIGAGESAAFHYLSRAAAAIARDYPGVRFQLTSGDTADLMDELSKGLIDFALIFSDFDQSLYQSLQLPGWDQFGLLMPKASPLAKKAKISWDELSGYPLLLPRAAEAQLASSGHLDGMQIVAVYNLLFNASLMVEDGVGYAICLDQLVNTTGDSQLAFRELDPPVKITGTLIWKKYQVFSPAVQLFIKQIQQLIESR